MKQAIVARADLGMGEGKLAAQVAHASLQAYEEATGGAQREWKGEGQKKIVLQADGEAPTFFEVLTALALWHFDREGGDIRLVRQLPALETLTRDEEWGEEAFRDAGEATFGGS